MSSSDPLKFLDARRSVPSRQLGEPGPDHATLLRMLQAAARVPDHGKLVPFRFLRLRGDARHALGEYLARRSRERDPAPPRHALGERLAQRALQRDPDASVAALDKDRGRFSHAPLIVAVIARLTPGHKVPEQEQLLSAGSACFALLQAAQALGYGAQWLTGWAAYDDVIARTLGLGEHEKIVGFVHVGTPKLDAPERERPDAAALLSDFVP